MTVNWGSETQTEKGFVDGKSETCRASEWQSHNPTPHVSFGIPNPKSYFAFVVQST